MDETTASDVRAMMRQAASGYLDTDMADSGLMTCTYTLAAGFRDLDTGTVTTKDGLPAFTEDALRRAEVAHQVNAGPASNTEAASELAGGPHGICEVCRDRGVPLMAVLSADPDQAVCESCHTDPRLPTVSLAVVNDSRPVYVVSRGDLARIAGREATDEEARRTARAIEHSTAKDAVGDAVFQVCGYPSGAEDE